MSIHARLHEAQKAIHGIAKTGHNPHFRYDFFEEKEVLRVAKEALSDAGIAFFYSVEEVRDREVTTRKGNEELITDVKMACTLYDAEDGTSLSGGAWGRGQDGQDKGVNKAIVAGLKYWLLKVLMIPTDDDTESGKNTNEAGNQPKPKDRPERPAQRPTPASGSFDLSEEVQKGKHKGKSWAELAKDEPSYIKYVLDKWTDISAEMRHKLEGALQGERAGATELVKLQDLLNKAASVPVIDIDQAAKIEEIIDQADPDLMRKATERLEKLLLDAEPSLL